MSFTGLERTYYKNGMDEQPTPCGQLHKEYYKINNKNQGLYKSYWSNGQLTIICNYVDGKKMGNINHIMRMVCMS